MRADITDRCRNMILGALVADAAAVGLHWIYDQSRIREVAPLAPEFVAPDPKHYHGVPAYFAHAARHTGEQSQYGEQTIVMLRALAETEGRYDAVTYANAFRAHFGYGGGYVGYIDHATRDTLDNARRYEDDARRIAFALPFDGEDHVRIALLGKALPLLTPSRRNDFEATVHQDYHAEDVRTYAMRMFDALTALPPARGAQDLQLPAISKLPGLVAVLTARASSTDADIHASAASAVRVTNDHPTAAVYGDICAHIMQAALRDGSVAAVRAAALERAPGDARALLQEALKLADQTPEVATQHFGLACDLPFGVPSALHNIATAATFADAVRANIYAGGDSCGRAMLVGAVMGAVHGLGGETGIPPEWAAQLTSRNEVDGLLARLLL